MLRVGAIVAPPATSQAASALWMCASAAGTRPMSFSVSASIHSVLARLAPMAPVRR